MVLPVGHKEIVIVVNVNAPRHVELNRARAVLATARQVLAILGKHLDAVVAAVDHVEVVVAIAGQTSRPIELSRSRPRSTPYAHKVAVWVKYRNTVQPIIGHVGIALLVQGHCVQPHALPRAGTAAAEFPLSRFGAWRPNRHLRDSRSLVALATPVDNVRDALGCQSNRTGVSKTVAGGRITADRT